MTLKKCPLLNQWVFHCAVPLYLFSILLTQDTVLTLSKLVRMSKGMRVVWCPLVNVPLYCMDRDHMDLSAIWLTFL